MQTIHSYIGNPSDSKSQKKDHFSDPQIYSVTQVSHKAKRLNLRSSHLFLFVFKKLFLFKEPFEETKKSGSMHSCVGKNSFMYPLPLNHLHFSRKENRLLVKPFIHPCHIAVTQISNATYTLLCDTL